MGGKAFASGPNALWTPRLSPPFYYALRDRYISFLKTFYKHVESPIDAPSKADFGDIDILVAGPTDHLLSHRPGFPPSNDSTVSERTSFEPWTFNDHVPILQQALAPKQIINIPQSPTVSFAMYHGQLPGAYVQVDIHYCASEQEWSWMLFLQAHGDLWNLLGTSLRPYGLTATNLGLFVRDHVIDDFDHKRSRIFLTNKPAEALALLGYTQREFWGGQSNPAANCMNGENLESQKLDKDNRQFATVGDMYAFAARCRFFRKRWYIRSMLKSNDRQRMGKRDAFRRFVEEYAESLPSDTDGPWSGKREREEREKLMNEVLDRFDKRAEWVERRKIWDEEREGLRAKRIVKLIKGQAMEEEFKYADAWIREVQEAAEKAVASAWEAL